MHVEHFAEHAEALDAVHGAASAPNKASLHYKNLSENQQLVTSAGRDGAFLDVVLNAQVCPNTVDGNLIITRTRGGKTRQCRLQF